MRRREFISSISGTLALILVTKAHAATNLRRIGFLTPRTRPTPPDHDAFSDAFLKGMSALGYSDGENVVIDWRYADGDYKRLTGYGTELVQLNPLVIVTYGTAAARVLQSATKDIPVVVAAAVDLVGAGIVSSLARPGGNITGLSVIDTDISPKQLELLKELTQRLSRVAVLLNPGNSANSLVLKHVTSAASTVGTEVIPVTATKPEEFAKAFSSASQQGADGMIIAADAFFSGQGGSISAVAARYRVPTISLYRDHALAGCLVSYGQNVAEFHRRAATYVDKILKGAKPEDLPVEQPTKFDLVVNLKAAQSLGLTIPPSLLARADEVIE
jgi:putative ABC transport system substrate-binding protein